MYTNKHAWTNKADQNRVPKEPREITGGEQPLKMLQPYSFTAADA
jgi:hypothetical protein